MVSSASPRSLTARHEWRLFGAGLLFTLVLPLRLMVDDLQSSSATTSRKLPEEMMDAFMTDDGVVIPAFASPVSLLSRQAERDILQFFQGEARALHDGVRRPNNPQFLAQRLADRMERCRPLAPRERLSHGCTLKMVFTGSAQTSGRDNFHNETYPFLLEERLRPIVETAGLQLQVLNHAMDSDLMREGPQSTHMCIANWVGGNVDIVAWDMEDNMQANPPAQTEAFLRWTIGLNPAMIVFHRMGPHTKSRRGKKTRVANLGPGHDAVLFQDDPNDMPQLQQGPYHGSPQWKEQWAGDRNAFWDELFQQYGSFVDIVAIDPIGSIHHLDHLEEFSNQAFDADKVLPLVDCGKQHPPPCNQIPDDFAKKFKDEGITNVKDKIPPENSAQFCWAQVGCRHVWYGGKLSHELRAALNTLPILRSFQTAEKQSSKSLQRPSRALSTLPPPKHCNPTYCSLKPTCITSYVPNLGPDLANAITWTNKSANLSTGKNQISPMPRKGISHFLDDPNKQVENIDLRYGALGYMDRKFAYHLSAAAPPFKTNAEKLNHYAWQPHSKKPHHHLDVSAIDLSFHMTGPGPIIVCEPPSFIDAFPKHRLRPLIEHVKFQLEDGKELIPPKHPPTVVEVGGPFCKTISANVPAGDHTLRITATAVFPKYVMISHLITFS